MLSAFNIQFWVEVPATIWHFYSYYIQITFCNDCSLSFKSLKKYRMNIFIYNPITDYVYVEFHCIRKEGVAHNPYTKWILKSWSNLQTSSS